MPLNKDDVFPLWSFGYRETPIHDRNKTATTRGRTAQEAWQCVQYVSGPYFLEPEKVGVANQVRLEDKKNYDQSHKFDWLHEPPLWLKLAEGAHDQIW
jgi:hypothetical protein